jgi:hypothetical protein
MNRWAMFGFILAFLTLPTIAFSVKANYPDNAESNEYPIPLLLTAQEIGADINTTSPTSTPTFVTSNSSTPTATTPESKTIPAAQIIALSASVIVAAVCLWICFKKPNPTRTQYYKPKAKYPNAYFPKTAPFNNKIGHANPRIYHKTLLKPQKPEIVIPPISP